MILPSLPGPTFPGDENAVVGQESGIKVQKSRAKKLLLSFNAGSHSQLPLIKEKAAHAPAWSRPRTSASAPVTGGWDSKKTSSQDSGH